ncbi:Transcriptional activator CadC [Photobacterium malacitanum]|uniref:Transcriptional activator CadC n=1 Tax=Photobacterium malacitanum TaxID=2204294 RepID=A0A1Y6MMB2_9GAMM|nr:winged helix-turn-helix domain-containing protein [Photobacterium malacitanum]SMY37725.1 Transcriptional activator CadC [Photobacterium malacitanum]
MAWVNYKINNWLLITTENCLYKSGQNYIIEPRITKLLAFLAKHQGIVFTRDELIENVWDGAVVSEQVVTQSIFELRKTLKKMDEDHWIVTIPKRGYKLDIDVQQIYVDPNTGFKLEEFHPSHEHTNDTSSHAFFPAGPMTRAFNETSKEAPSTTTTSSNNVKWNHWFFDICILTMLLITLVFISWSNEKVTPPATILNPRLINIELTQQSSTNQLYSIAKIINNALFKSTNYISSFSEQPNAGKTLSLYVNQQHQLHIELFNNISKTVMLQQNLHLDSNNSYLIIDGFLNKLIQALNYNHQQIQNHITLTNPTILYGYLELPSVINNDGQTNINYIKKISKLIKLSPKNSYLLAQRYLAYATILTINNKVTSMPTLMNYGKELVKSITANQQLGSSEIYDALALNDLYQGNLADAEHYLSLAKLQSQQNTALRYILLGKLSELAHKKQQANEYYSMAMYLSPSQETLQLCQKLVFISEINTAEVTPPH